jgi:hypothetical protein
MNATEWREFLQEVSRVILAKEALEIDDVNRPNFPQAVRDAGYIGYEGASEEQIVVAEARLGVRFPPSYRTFLSVSNGWPVMWHSAEAGELWSTEKIGWARDQDPNLVEVWGEVYDEVSPEEHLRDRGEASNGGFRAQYVKNLLAISDHGDACDLLLSPEVVDENGELECWLIASWIPGAARHSSFEAWFRSAYEFQRSAE